MIEFIKIIINVHNMNNMRKLIYGLLAVLVIATLWLSVGSLDKSSKEGAPPALPELNVGVILLARRHWMTFRIFSCV